MSAGVRERARQALRAEIAEATSALFAERGFDAVTVEDAAREVGISRATFFRYFGSKEDAVLATLEGSSFDFGAVLTNLPPVEDECAWQLLHRTFRHALAPIDDSPQQERARLRMIHTTASIRARLADRRLVHEDSLTAALAERISPPEAARTVVIAALAVLDLAWRSWATGDEPCLQKAVDEIFTHLNVAGKPTSHPAA